MLEIYHSNRLEILVEDLAKTAGKLLDDPFKPETIVVQNQGMARWIDQQLAMRQGISARIDYPLPASFFWQVLQAWLPDAPDSELFDKEALLWRVMRLLPQHLAEPAFAPLARYLMGDISDLLLYQLSRRIADLFDQYLVFRPDEVLSWEQGGDTHWQALLWRALCTETKHAHRARLFMRLERAMLEDAPKPGGLPQRASLFGLTALAPVYVRMLGALARHIPVDIYYLNPCREYWADIEGERGQARRRARAKKAGLPDPSGVLDVGNPLLASLGHAGQVFLDQLLELGGTDKDRIEQPVGDSLLRHIQRDILELTDARAQTDKPAVSPDDISIQIHSAHGPLREVQVLHDRLLHVFECLPGLEPRDIIVMAPDIDQYAPYVDAVFGAATPPRRIPWSIADRSIGAEQPILETLKLLLALPRSRFEASELLSVLEVPAVQRRFGLNDDGLERIHAWVQESGVRWGENAAMREGFDLPPEGANTWEFGLQRLFLGYSLPPDPEGETYQGILPYVDVEGSEAVWLGVLQSFVELLGTWRKHLRQARKPDEWRTALNELMEALFAPDEDEEPVMQGVRDRLDALVLLAQNAEFDQAVTLDVIRAFLDGLFEDTGGAQRFLTGRVSFCNMVPMRSIPFRVVCLIGMSGEDFPRSQRPVSFDLMARKPRRGDRSRRRDDRYLFLEAILSARDVLYLSYVGNDVRDNSIKIPSVVLSELLDYIRHGYAAENGKAVDKRLLVRHPLQPFSRTYFDHSDPRLFSYAEAWADAARTPTDAETPRFADRPLGSADDALKTLDMEDLIRFLRKPPGYFLTRRLGLKLQEEHTVLEDAELFDADNLQRYQLRQSLLQQLQRGRDISAILERLRAEGVLPHGAPGALLLHEQMEVAGPFLQRLEKYQQEPLPPLEVDLLLGSFRLQGQLRGLSEAGLLASRLGKLRCVDRLTVWVRHLVLNALAPEGVDSVSRFLAEDHTLTLQPVEQAANLLRQLLELRWQGLQAPLAFFPESSLAWQLEQKYGNKFHIAWSGEFNPQRECDDTAVHIAFRGRDPIDGVFEANASCILAPMLEHSKTITAKKDLA